jgi:hypothetical protein
MAATQRGEKIARPDILSLEYSVGTDEVDKT